MNRFARLALLSDHLRLDEHSHPQRDWYKEWQHFCIIGDDIRIIVNFNLSTAHRSPAQGGAKTAHLICLIEHNGCWFGDVERFAMSQVGLEKGRIDWRMNHNELRFANGRYELSVALAERPISLELTLNPLTFPLIRNNARLGRGKIDWVVFPRLLANGRIRLGGQVIDLHQVPAYHDHNWGHWVWGDDFSWQWGYSQPQDTAQPWCFVINQVTDRSRNRVQELKVSIWQDDRLVRIFSRSEIQLRQFGALPPQKPAKFPRVMALITPEYSTDIPQYLEITAAQGGDSLFGHVYFDDVAQILVPNDADLETTTINEVSSSYTFEAIINGQAINMTGRGFFEFLT